MQIEDPAPFKKILFPVIVLFLVMGIPGLAKDLPGPGAFQFTQDETWKTTETVTLHTMDSVKGVASTTVTISQAEYQVLKVFPDGSSLVQKKLVKLEKGTSSKDLRQEELSPSLSALQFLLLDTAGETFLVQPKPTFEDPEEEAASEQSGFVDEVSLLKKAGQTKEFFAKERSPLDWYKISLKKIKINEKFRKQGWVITRTQDEKINGAACEVYEADMKPLKETTWFDRLEGCVVQRKMVQQGDIAMEIIQIRLK